MMIVKDVYHWLSAQLMKSTTQPNHNTHNMNFNRNTNSLPQSPNQSQNPQAQLIAENLYSVVSYKNDLYQIYQILMHSKQVKLRRLEKIDCFTYNVCVDAADLKVVNITDPDITIVVPKNADIKPEFMWTDEMFLKWNNLTTYVDPDIVFGTGSYKQN